MPDIAGWRRERMQRVPNVAGFQLAPDFVCEVLSPSTASFDRVGKLAIYCREGVPYVWLLDPIVRTLEVLQLESGRWLVAGNYGGDQIVSAPPFAAAEIDLLSLWGETRERSNEADETGRASG